MAWQFNNPIGSTAFLLLLGLGACQSPKQSDSNGAALYGRLESLAEEPSMRAAVCEILSDDLHPLGRKLALTWRLDADPIVRAACYRWLVSVDQNRTGDWLEEGLNDPSIAVQVACILKANRITEWSEGTDDALWRILNTTPHGHVFQYTANTLTERYGRDGVIEIWDVLLRRGSGWDPFALPAMVRYPEPEYRDTFASLMQSDDPDLVCLAQRGLNALDALDAGELGEPIEPFPCFTTEEFHDRWEQDLFRVHEPNVLSQAEMTLRLRAARVIVLGELHAWLPTRGAQIEVLASLSYFAHDRLTLVCELPVVDYQNPVIEAAKQYGIEIRMLEEEPLASQGSPSTRDEFARQRLAEMLIQEPDRTFVICYGYNHQASLQRVAQDLGIPNLSIALYPFDGMLGSAMRKTGGAIEGLYFQYPQDNYFLPCAPFAAILGCPELDDALAKPSQRN